MTTSAKDMNKLKKVLAIKRGSIEAKYSQIKQIQSMVVEKIEEIVGNLEEAERASIEAEAAFFGSNQNLVTEAEIRRFMGEAKAAAKRKLKDVKNKELLEAKMLELEEVIRSYQLQIVKLDKKADFLFS
jgi:hypothetical protein